MNFGSWLSTELSQSGTQLAELFLALFLSSLIGLEREFKMKSAGLRTHTLVGVAAALIMLVSKFGFNDVISKYEIVLDPSRIAAQIVSGIGFIGGGLIFVQRDVVRGLTTAAIIWLTAAVGMACGAGLPTLAIFVTATHLLVMYVYPLLTRRLASTEGHIVIRYLPGKGSLQESIRVCTSRRFSVPEVAVQSDGNEHAEHSVRMDLRGRSDIDSLLLALGDLKGVVSVNRDATE